jgi:hypothetical protein
MKHALTVPVEPFKFSSRQGGVAYELSYHQIHLATLNRCSVSLESEVNPSIPPLTAILLIRLDW